ncbi:MAG: glycine cleavage system aminomethyltransferase GcvT [Acidobacteriota bacterium]|nr:glycine cleavage system aminomethyltransferase GcvT [Blastocatellia bacterium]MDW8411864.1 glycine cleavage system aminomethyltransferase GcvT [Acidobacteriota bacterium]
MSNKLTPLNEVHRRLGAKLISFAGWEMPVQYQGAVQEHLAVRTCAGLFDVSHMGEIEIKGNDALALVQKVTCNDASKLKDGQIQYSGLMTEKGTFVDDLLVHRLNAQHFLLCVNAANTEKDYAWICRHADQMNVEVLNTSDRYFQIALQGPLSLEILQPLTDTDLHSIKYYWFTFAKVANVPVMIARTGYTGEDGFEIYGQPEDAVPVWDAILDAGRPKGLVAAGLAARNTLRLEAKMMLYGNDIDETTSVLEADLGWILKLNKGDFLGREVLEKQKQAGVQRKIVGFEVLDKAPARDGYPIIVDSAEYGKVTSGSPSPYLKKNIGLAYLPTEKAVVGYEFAILVRGRQVPARVVETPFYKRKKN